MPYAKELKRAKYFTSRKRIKSLTYSFTLHERLKRVCILLHHVKELNFSLSRITIFCFVVYTSYNCFFNMASEAFTVAIRALRLKRRSFSKEVTGLLKDARSDEGFSKEAFNERKDYIEQCWGEIVASTSDCVGLVDDGEEKEEVDNELNEQLESLRVQKELFFDLGVEIVKKTFDMADVKSLELFDGDTSQEMRKTVANGSEGDKLTSTSIEELDDVSVNGVVDQ